MFRFDKVFRSGKLVVLRIADGNFDRGFAVSLRIGEDSDRLLSTEMPGRLPPSPELFEAYRNWQTEYLLAVKGARMKKPERQKTNISQDTAAKKLKTNLNYWLDSQEFRPIREKCLEKLDQNDEIRFILQTEEPTLRRLPWPVWNFLELYPQAEIALGAPAYDAVKRDRAGRTRVRILAILGDSSGINIESDRQFLQSLPGAETVFLPEPSRAELDEQLWDSRGWDIIFFAGHSDSKSEGEKGKIYLNPADSYGIEDFKWAMREAIARGLNLAIFNSCDGLGIARDLAALHIPQIVVMREPVPDRVAQEFLKDFLSAYTGGKSLYLSVREARERLHGLEDRHPSASWLPVICQHPAELPKSWQELRSLRVEYPEQDYRRKKDYRDRHVLLNKVKEFWIKGSLEQALHCQVPIILDLEKRLDAVDYPWTMVWETADWGRQQLPPGEKALDLFDDMGAGRTLLILGEPGSGKTITLLQIARDLLDRAAKDGNHPIPVVFNLSTWGSYSPPKPLESFFENLNFNYTPKTKTKFSNWLVEELDNKYRISKQLALKLVEKERLLLLLDGLDEAKYEVREDCVEEINRFSRECQETEIVVCSRISDYEALPRQLGFQGAIYLQPLSPQQIHRYLTSLGSQLEAAIAILETDTVLQELAKTPLMLNVMSVAYQGLSLEELPKLDSVEQQRSHLFDTYIQRMFDRRRLWGKNDDERSPRHRQPIANSFSVEKSRRWLSYLAQKMSQKPETIFLIERMQPTWLPRKHKQIYALTFASIFAGIFTLILTLIFGLIISRVIGVLAWTVVGVITLIVFIVVYGTGAGIWAFLTIGQHDDIKPVETLKISFFYLLKSVALALVLSLTTWVVSGLLFYLMKNWQYHFFQLWQAMGIMGFVAMGLILFPILNMGGAAIEKTSVANQGMRQSVKHAIAFATWGAITVGTFAGVARETIITLLSESYNSPVVRSQLEDRLGTGTLILCGMLLGLLVGLTDAGMAALQHLALRIVLYCQGHIPWNYARFLDYATERIFLQKIGGSYSFIHRLLRDHFAKMSDDS